MATTRPLAAVGATVGCLLVVGAAVSCSSSRQALAGEECSLLTSDQIKSLLDLDAALDASQTDDVCRVRRSGSDDPFLVVAEIDNLGDAALTSAAAGDPVDGAGDEAVVSEDGDLGASAAVRVGGSAVRIDLGPVGDRQASGELALKLARAASKRLPDRPRSDDPAVPSVCTRIAAESLPRLSLSLRARDLSASSCELSRVGGPGSVVVSGSTDAGADVAQLEVAAGAGAIPANFGPDARWTPGADGRGGSLWVLDSGRILQFSVLDVGEADGGVAMATAVAGAVLELEREG